MTHPLITATPAFDLCPSIAAMVHASTHDHPFITPATTMGVVLSWGRDRIIPTLRLYSLQAPALFRTTDLSNPSAWPKTLNTLGQGVTIRLESLLFTTWKSRLTIKREGLIKEGQHLLLYDGPATATTSHQRLAMAPYAHL